MGIEEQLGNFFKAEVRASGRRLFAEEKVSITAGSDTTIKAYVRASPPVTVKLESAGIEARALTADCSCPFGKKAQFCKHVWGALVAADAKFPDFLSEKNAVDKPDSSSKRGGDVDEMAGDSYAEASKRRATEYRKDQYQKQKAQSKARKDERRGRESAAKRAFSPEVEESLRYFELNGFPMPDGPEETVLAEAKRKLSRVFHPDKGGSHAETVELNRHCQVIQRFLRA